MSIHEIDPAIRETAKEIGLTRTQAIALDQAMRRQHALRAWYAGHGAAIHDQLRLERMLEFGQVGAEILMP